MDNREDDHVNGKPILLQIASTYQFREALSRLRYLENAKTNSPEGRERAALEIAVSRYLATTQFRGRKA